MLKINQDDMSISLTRGDSVAFDVQAKQGDSVYEYAESDIIHFRVSEAKDVGEELLALSFRPIKGEDGKYSVQVQLDAEDTRNLGKAASKPVEYWYEVALENSAGEQTIIGYDEDGAKIFRLYPEIKKTSTE